MMGSAASWGLAWALAAQPAEAPSVSGPVSVANSQMDAILGEAMRKMARRHNEDGLREYRSGNHPAALEHFKRAHELIPDDPEVINNLGLLYFLLGNHAEAESYLRQTLQLQPDRYVAYLNLVEVLLSGTPAPGRLDEAAALLMRAREVRGNDGDLILRQARVAVQRHQDEQAERFYREAASILKNDNDVRLELGDFLRTLDRDEEAMQWYRKVKGDTEVMRKAEERIRGVEVDRQARLFGWLRPSTEIPEKARTLHNRARTLMEQDRSAEAEALLKEVIRQAPQFVQARVDLAATHHKRGHLDQAEMEYLRALAFDQSNPSLHEQLGLLYAAQPGRGAEAATLLSRALQLRPDWTHIHLDLARALRVTGDLPGALQHVDLFLAGQPAAESLRDAQDLKATLQKLLGQAPSTPPETPPEQDRTPDRVLAMQLSRARAYLARGETDAAMAELQQVMSREDRVEVRNLQGRILLAAGRAEDAAAAFRASLSADEKQPDIHLQLGILDGQAGRRPPARRHFRRAEELGEPDAAYHLARLDMERVRENPPRFWEVARLMELDAIRQRLRTHQRTVGITLGLASVELEHQVGEIFWGTVGPPVVAPLLALLLGLIAFRRRYGGVDLMRLVETHPQAGPEVQRLLSAIRHEVLKHNTMALTGLAEAMDRGDDVSSSAAHVRESLLGVDGRGGVRQRFQEYVAQLRQLGRTYNVSLNLERRDRALSAIHRGMTILGRLNSGLGRAGQLPRWRRRALLRSVRKAARLLNTEGYEAVRALLDGIRVLQVDPSMLMDIYQRATREPQLQAAHVHPLVFDTQVPLPVAICIPRGAFEDILLNLFRNAIQASLKSRMSGVSVGLSVRSEVNAITGHERVLFLVLDRSPEVLTTEMVRTQSIEGGLGLAADLVTRYGGSLDVAPGTGPWSKAVVVKLPREETPEEEEVNHA